MMAECCESLLEIGVLVRDDDGVLRFAQWDKRNGWSPSDTPDQVSKRVANHRARKRGADADSAETVTPTKSPSPNGVTTYVTGDVTRGVTGVVTTPVTTARSREVELELEGEREEELEANSKQPRETEPTVLLAAAANRGIRKQFGEQPAPIRHDAGASHEAAVAIAAAGVPVDFARDAIYTCATSLGKIPKTLKYFVPVVLERWAAKQAYAAADSSDAKELTPAVASTKRVVPSALVTEQRASEERQQEQRDAAEFKRRQRRALQWAKDHPEEYEQLRAEVERGYAGMPANDITRKAIEVELVSRCADLASRNSGQISEAVR
jgi:hypothetical protein